MTSSNLVAHIHRIRVIYEDDNPFWPSVSVKANLFIKDLKKFRLEEKARHKADKIHFTYTQIPEYAIEDPQTN